MIYYNKKHISNLLINRTKRITCKTMYDLTMIIGKCYIHTSCLAYGAQWPVMV